MQEKTVPLTIKIESNNTAFLLKPYLQTIFARTKTYVAVNRAKNTMLSKTSVANMLIYEMLLGSKTYIMITGRIFNFRNLSFILFIYSPKNQYVPTLSP